MSKKNNTVFIASLSAAVSSEAAVVQITQSGNSLSVSSVDFINPRSVSFSDNLSADLTGDGIDDISISDAGIWGKSSPSAPYAPTTGYGDWLGVRINGSRQLVGVGTTLIVNPPITSTFINSSQFGTTTETIVFQPGEITCNGATATVTTAAICGITRSVFSGFTSTAGNNYGGLNDRDPSLANEFALLSITFNDPTYGGQVNGWLQMYQSGSNGLELQRVIFDQDNPLVRPAVASNAPAFPEASPVPEPSGISLLAMGAAGVLLRRKRHAA